MDKKRRNILLLCAAILLVSFIARNAVMTALRQARQQAQHQKPSPKGAANPDEPIALPNLSGIWQGHGRVPGGRGLCDLRLEIKSAEPGRYSGYSRFSCLNEGALVNPKDVNAVNNFMNHTGNPDAAVLSGTVENGAIHFHADKTIGTDINGCAVTDLTITPFGARRRRRRMAGRQVHGWQYARAKAIASEDAVLVLGRKEQSSCRNPLSPLRKPRDFFR